MPNADTDLVFPARVIPLLRDLRGPSWEALVARVLTLPEEHPDTVAFMLLMARLAHCETCTPIEYRAQQGCSYCAVQALKRYRGTDEDLLRQYRQAQAEIQQHI